MSTMPSGPRFQMLEEKIDALAERLNSVETVLRAEIREGDEETRRHMRVLHEEVISRIALLHEGSSDSRQAPRRSRRKKH